MDPLISPEELRAAPHRPVLLDARSGSDAPARFWTERLAGARRVDLEADLSAASADPSLGGRHPLPPPAAFAATLGRLGVTPDAPVVVYDDQGGANAASRCWWLLRAAGHGDVRVLDGGIQAALAAGLPLASGPPEPHPAAPPYPFAAYLLPTVDADGVAAAPPARVTLDARAPARFRGELDPYDPNPGHIPGAVNVFHGENLGSDGRFLQAPALAARYGAVVGARRGAEIVVSCGSGVTACHTLLALERAGFGTAALYVGSFSEWTRQGRLVAVGDD